MMRSDEIRLVYLAALHNSGSTVISVVANSHPEMVSPGEMVGPGGRHHGANGPDCSCSHPVAECPFWLEVSRRYSQRGYRWTPANWALKFEFEGRPRLSRLAFGRPGPQAYRDQALALIPFTRGVIENLRNRNRCFVQTILQVSGKRVLFDASKHPERIAHFSHIAGMDLRVVHLIRDPRGWCNSRKRGTQMQVGLIAQAWVQRNEYIERLVNALPPKKHTRIRYEDFCHNPQKVMDDIYKLSSLPTAALPEDLRGTAHHLLGNRMRTRGDASIRLDTSWERELSREEVAVVERVAAPLARRYGYDF